MAKSNKPKLSSSTAKNGADIAATIVVGMLAAGAAISVARVGVWAVQERRRAKRRAARKNH